MSLSPGCMAFVMDFIELPSPVNRTKTIRDNGGLIKIGRNFRSSIYLGRIQYGRHRSAVGIVWISSPFVLSFFLFTGNSCIPPFPPTSLFYISPASLLCFINRRKYEFPSARSECILCYGLRWIATRNEFVGLTIRHWPQSNSGLSRSCSLASNGRYLINWSRTVVHIASYL